MAEPDDEGELDDEDEPDYTAEEPGAVVWGWFFLVFSLLIVALLIVQGIGVARSTRPDPNMGPPTHILCTLTLGPFALILLLGAFRMIRRKRWD